jgi:hypothetical protein
MTLPLLFFAVGVMTTPLILSVIGLFSKRIRRDPTGQFTKQRLLSWLGVAAWFPGFVTIVLALFSLSSSDMFIALSVFFFLLSYVCGGSAVVTLYVRKPTPVSTDSPPKLNPGPTSVP